MRTISTQIPPETTTVGGNRESKIPDIGHLPVYISSSIVWLQTES